MSYFNGGILRFCLGVNFPNIAFLACIINVLTPAFFNLSKNLYKFPAIIIDMGTDNDQSGCFRLRLFNPASTTFLKSFQSRASLYEGGSYAMDVYTGGYCNVTAAIDGVQFKMSSGNIDAGTIKMYGLKDS